MTYLVFWMVCLVFGIWGINGAEAEAKKLKAGMDSSVSIFGSLNLVFGSLGWRIWYFGWFVWYLVFWGIRELRRVG